MRGRGGVHRIYYPKATSGTLVSIANGATYGNSLAISRGANTFSMSMAASGNGNPVNVTTAANYPSSQWYHLAMTRDSTGTVRLFVNGSLAATGTYAGPGKTNDRILINGLYDNNGLAEVVVRLATTKFGSPLAPLVTPRTSRCRPAPSRGDKPSSTGQRQAALFLSGLQLYGMWQIIF